MKLDGPLDELPTFFLRLSGRDAPWQIGHIGAPGSPALFVDDEILHCDYYNTTNGDSVFQTCLP